MMLNILKKMNTLKIVVNSGCAASVRYLLLLCVRRQRVTPDFMMKEAVRWRSSRLPWSLFVISLGTGQIMKY